MTVQVARVQSLTIVGWTADTQDWRGGPHEEMLARVEGEVLRESIVLMHDGVGPGATREGCAETVALVRPLVSLARSRSLEPAPLDELHHPSRLWMIRSFRVPTHEHLQSRQHRGLS